MKLTAFMLILFCFFSLYCRGQFNYIAANAQNVAGTYTDLGTSGTSISTNFSGGAMTFDDDNSSIQDIGFNFTYNGTVFTQFVLNTNGFIKLGNTAPFINNYNIANFETNVIAAFNCNLLGGTAPEYRVVTTGTPGSRVCTIQYKDVRDDGSTLQFSSINFQVKLYETSNNVEFIYGNFIPSGNTALTFFCRVCLKPENLSRLLEVLNWGATWADCYFYQGTTSFFDVRNDKLPDPGRTFRFVAAPLNDAAVSSVYTLSKLPVPLGNPNTVQARISNVGSTVLTDLPVKLTVTAAGVSNIFTDTKIITLAPQTDTVVSFDPYFTIHTGTNNLYVEIPNDDFNDNNSGFYTQIVNDTAFNYANDDPIGSSFGWGTDGGILLNKYKITGSGTVRKVNVNIGSAAGNNVYAVLMDAAGVILAQSDNYTTLASDLSNYKSLIINDPPVLSNTTFYVGIAQLPSTIGYYAVSYQDENPVRSGAYYFSGLAGGIPTESTFPCRFMIEAILDPLPVQPNTNEYSNSYWTWAGGDSIVDAIGQYGSQGVPSVSNKPSSRTSGVTWTDSTGNLWLFGGNHFSGNFNDLWKYNPSSGEWTWMKGSNTDDDAGSYGVLQTASQTNNPPGRSAAVSWKDTSGNFWLYGGSNNNGALNDLWKYNPSLNEWTWMKGDSTANSFGVYGSVGVSTNLNNPRSRSGAFSWTDSIGNLWLFGGLLYEGEGEGPEYYSCNDLWKFNISSTQWVWVSGDSVPLVNPAYGMIGVPNTLNTPGARAFGVSWKDKQNNFWLYGGDAFGDLWKFNLQTNEWTWIKGDSVNGALAVYGTQGVAAVNNNPGARTRPHAWVDQIGNFWLFGGSVNGIDLHDLWKYDPGTNQWAWLKGSFQNYDASYGNLGIETPANIPGARDGGITWADSSGNLWLFGGFGRTASNTGYLNDLWKIYAGRIYIFTGNGDWDTASNWLSHLIAPRDIPGATSVIIDHIMPGGVCDETGDINIQNSGLLTIRPTKNLNIINGSLTNSGSLNGTGTVTFSGAPTALNSPGSITAPLILIHKELFLTGNTNTSDILLTDTSHIRLDSFYLNMDAGVLTADSNNFIITNDTGRLWRQVGATAIPFHIGVIDTSYTPVTVTNSGTVGIFKARVAPGVNTFSKNVSQVSNAIQTTGYVDRTWFVDSTIAGSNLAIEVQWKLENEQPLFDRSNSYVSQNHSCPLPPNCSGGYFDIVTRSAASGSDPYTQSRNNVVSPTFFVVKSGADTLTFIGNGNWNDPDNWRIGIVPSYTIGMGRVIIIDHIAGGECFSDEEINVMPGGEILVQPTKILRVPNLIIH